MTRHLLSRIDVAVIIAVLTIAANAFAASGDLDTTFGIQGLVADTTMDSIQATLVQPDGKIVVVGNRLINPTPGTVAVVPAIARYNTDGALDYGFGTQGWVLADNTNAYGNLYSVVIQSDGKLIAAGYSSPSALVVRLNPDGSFDTTFSSDGKVKFNFPGTNHAVSFLASVALIPNSDKIMVAGHVEYAQISGEDPDDTGIARINANGTLDSTFGYLGRVILETDESQVSAMAINPANKKIALTLTINVSDFYVMMLNETGTYDTTFSGDGIVKTDINGGYDSANTLAFQRFFVNVGGFPAITYKLVVGGIAYGTAATEFDSALVRYKLDGTLDTTFGTNGKVRRALSYQRDTIEDLQIDSQGRIVTSGPREWNYLSSFAVQRFLADGSVDNSFGSQGKVYTKIYAGGVQVDSEPSGLALAADGKIVVVGGFYSGHPRVVARYEP